MLNLMPTSNWTNSDGGLGTAHSDEEERVEAAEDGRELISELQQSNEENKVKLLHPDIIDLEQVKIFRGVAKLSFLPIIHVFYHLSRTNRVIEDLQGSLDTLEQSFMSQSTVVCIDLANDALFSNTADTRTRANAGDAGTDRPRGRAKPWGLGRR
jgi:hypothetical protein